MMPKVGERFGEYQTTSGQRAPFLHVSLQSADLTVDERSRLLSTQSREEFFGRGIGFRLSQVTTRGHSTAKGFGRVRQWRGGLGPLRCVWRTSPARHVRQTVEKALEIRIAMRKLPGEDWDGLQWNC